MSSYLIRAITRNEKVWLNSHVVGEKVCISKDKYLLITELSKITFTGKANEPVSVYETTGARAELSIACALNLRRAPSAKNPTILLRIQISDLLNHGLRLDSDNPGDTGISAVDSMHRDVLGDVSGFEALTKILLERQQMGEDCLRIIYPGVMLAKYREFICATNGIGSDALRRATEQCKKTQTYFGEPTLQG